MTLFVQKPWHFKGRKTEKNTPIGRKCDETCTHRAPSASQCLCSVCHEVFGGITYFDQHRINGWCQNPAEIGMVVGSRGTWGTPMDPAVLNRFSELRMTGNEVADGDD